MDYKQEQEANQFAMELLMPTRFLERDCAGMVFDIDDISKIEKLAKRYDVSIQLMTIRLGQLGYFGT